LKIAERLKELCSSRFQAWHLGFLILGLPMVRGSGPIHLKPVLRLWLVSRLKLMEWGRLGRMHRSQFCYFIYIRLSLSSSTLRFLFLPPRFEFLDVFQKSTTPQNGGYAKSKPCCKEESCYHLYMSVIGNHIERTHTPGPAISGSAMIVALQLQSNG
jgi:hypothetical protein